MTSGGCDTPDRGPGQGMYNSEDSGASDSVFDALVVGHYEQQVNLQREDQIRLSGCVDKRALLNILQPLSGAITVEVACKPITWSFS